MTTEMTTEFICADTQADYACTISVLPTLMVARAGISMPTPDLDQEFEVLEVEQEPAQLIVYNDDINTFDHVIDTLIEVCGHTPEQAEQCTWLIHYKGKCCVKMGEWAQLAGMRNAICERGISAEVVE